MIVGIDVVMIGVGLNGLDPGLDMREKLKPIYSRDRYKRRVEGRGLYNICKRYHIGGIVSDNRREGRVVSVDS